MGLRRKLDEVFSQFRPDCALFSGGLDSAVAAVLTGCKKGIIVTLGEDAPDLMWACDAADTLRMDLKHVIISRQQALDALPEVIAVLKSFDPAIPNDLAVYFGLKEAQSLGCRSVITGDGSDELFGGYSYMQSIADLNEYIRRLSRVMTFNSSSLGRHFGIAIMQPFLQREIIEYALTLGQEWKIREVNGDIHGKWVLREALKGTLPDAILWQDKRPLEIGSGMTLLNDFFDTCISDNELIDKKQRYGIDFMNKAQSYYYEIYRQVVGDIPRPGQDEKPCGACGAGIKKDRSHCRVCGWVEGVLL
ncbi:MAG: asparagine synthetase [Deltaproteobacteria bacterium]|nr:asparagine synthetase [Deltaproteobacteria bacterium]